MDNINFYGHGGSGNHGCEAIVRSSVKMLSQPVTLFSSHMDQDTRYGLNEICSLVPDVDIPLVRGSREWLFAAIETKLTGKINKQVAYRKKNLLEKIGRKDFYFSIGGDNYCYQGTDILAAERDIIQRSGAKVVLWGCSVEPELLKQREIARDIAAYDLITARESLSYEALKKINPNTILVSDPAFILEKRDAPLPHGWMEGNMVGVNASPLIMQSGKNGQLVYNAYKKMIADILTDTEYGIVLVPHVVWKENDDREPLSKLYQAFRASGRIVLLDDCNCMELKGYISKCRMFVGARTHATIAAYSTYVPTLVLGYSVKSKGIARDLFGTEKDYVLSVHSLDDENALSKAFFWLCQHENEIRCHLKKMMPEYIERAFAAVDAVKTF